MDILIFMCILQYVIASIIVGELGKDKEIGGRAILIALFLTPIFGILCVAASTEKKLNN